MWHNYNARRNFFFFSSLKSKNVVWLKNSPADETGIISVSTTFFHRTPLGTECPDRSLLFSCDNVASSLPEQVGQLHHLNSGPDWVSFSAQGFFFVMPQRDPLKITTYYIKIV